MYHRDAKFINRENQIRRFFVSEKIVQQLQQKIADILTKKKRACEKELELALKKARESLENSKASYSNHPADNATNIDIPLTRIPTLQKMIVKYDEAFERLKKGDYGICKDCKKPIPLARLEAVPFADRCVDCKSIAEFEDTVPMNGGKRLSQPRVVMI